MKKLVAFLAVFIINLSLFGESNISQEQKINDLNAKIINYDSQVKNNIWLIRYANYNTYQNLLIQLDDIQNEIQNTNKKDIEKIDDLKNKSSSLTEQIELLKEYEKSPFQNMLVVPEIDEFPKITNPVALISGFSYIKRLKNEKEEYKSRLLKLEDALEVFRQKEIAQKELYDVNQSMENLSSLNETRREISEFQIAKDIATTTFGVYQKKLDEAINRASVEVKDQIKQTFAIILTIIVVILIGFLCKFIAKKYITDNQRFYTVNKFINVINFTIIIFVLLFAYIENVSYMVTILGFASAGLAIAMKDMFMSLLGWSVIIFGGTFHVGDRIRVRYQNSDYVGDIIDISLLRMTIYEDITLTTYLTNRRSGRIVFIPNNYIFTELIANYTHSGMKTVWDGIDIMLSFDSNHKKAMYIIKNITRKYSKGYTDIAKQQMNKLRDQYSIKNPNVEPRIYSFFEPYGINISVWYMTNSYAALALRSTISAEIIEALNLEDDIKIAYPTQTLFFGQKKQPQEIPDISKELLY
ncbi:mechanosensitive ion channel family protein [Campylobacter iguaniorum]|uniref:mechanosensitive ion channel family protein n=1 Tax=Campylobacter iguaniorum TaxID=1244531 RepID=UPI000739FD08|nr:mechanosensitive ion channel family protein [Campylobacter iguaniorum]ALV24412.1 mechanosensitive ion channel family protein [Campylobacter iguaniorum]